MILLPLVVLALAVAVALRSRGRADTAPLRPIAAVALGCTVLAAAAVLAVASWAAVVLAFLLAPFSPLVGLEPVRPEVDVALVTAFWAHPGIVGALCALAVLAVLLVRFGRRDVRADDRLVVDRSECS